MVAGSCSRAGTALLAMLALGAALGPALPAGAAAAAGTPHTVGLGDQGQLGYGGTANRSAFGPVSGLADAVEVAGGREHVLARDSGGAVWSWGDNAKGALGLGGSADRLVPTAVPGMSGVRHVRTGHYHSLVLLGDGTVRAWGYNAYGQLGDGTTTKRTTPVTVSGLSGVTLLAGGRDMSYALLGDGTVRSWGNNPNGELGDGTTTRRLTPVRVSGLSGVVDLAAGRNHGVAARGDGTVWTWGLNGSGQLGDGTRTSRLTPVKVAGISTAVAVAAGADHSVAVLADGSIRTWGEGGRGQLGSGSTADRLTPGTVAGLPAAREVDAGRDHNLLVTTAGELYAWGFNDYGQTGDGGTANRLSPFKVPGVGDAGGAGGGRGYSVVLRASGTADTTPPSAPGKPAASSTRAGEVDLTWAAASDDQASTLTYRVYRDGGTAAVGTVTSGSTTTVSFTDAGRMPGAVHTYTVDASDGTNVGPKSPASDTVTVAGDGGGVVLGDGFDAGLAAWTGVNGLAVDPDRAPPGGSAPSVRGDVTDAPAVAYRDLPAPEPVACAAATVLVERPPATSGVAAALLRLHASGQAVGRVSVLANRTLQVRADVTGTKIATAATMPVDRWRRVQLCAVTGSSGSLSLAVDGSAVGTWAASTGTAPLVRLQLGESGQRNTTINYDDVEVTRP